MIVSHASKLDLLVFIRVGEEIALHHWQFQRRLRHVLPHRAEVVLRMVTLRGGLLIRTYDHTHPEGRKLSPDLEMLST